MAVDYALLEADWTAGVKTPRQMAADYELLTGDKVSHTAIIKHFQTKLKMPRDLKARIRARTEEMISASLVDKPGLQRDEVADEAIVESAAKRGTEIVLRHQDDIDRYRKLAQKLLGEIESTSGNLELFDQLGELLRSENERGVDKLNDAYRRVIELPGRVDSFKKLAEVLKVLIGLERQAFGMADTAEGNRNPATPEVSSLAGTASINDAARRIAFMFMSATHQGGKQP